MQVLKHIIQRLIRLQTRQVIPFHKGEVLLNRTGLDQQRTSIRQAMTSLIDKMRLHSNNEFRHKAMNLASHMFSRRGTQEHGISIPKVHAGSLCDSPLKYR
jgi:hypothetical protein